MKRKSAVVFAFLSLALRLASYAQNVATTPSTTVKEMHPAFQTVDAHISNLVRADLSTDWAAYKQIAFEPASYEPANPERPLNQHDASKVRLTFQNDLTSVFRDVEAADGATIVVQPVITNITRTNTLVNLIGFAAIQMPLSYGGASVRYELLDGATGRQIGEITSSRSARPWNVYPWNLLQNFEALGQSSVILKSDAKHLRRDLARLAKLHGGQGDPIAPGAE